MKFFRTLWAAVVLVAAAASVAVSGAVAQDATAGAAPAKKVLRYAFEVAETSLDPVKLNDLYSRTLTAHIFEGLYHYDPLARPVKIKPLTADGMPQSSADFRVWTIKIKPGIYFASDPVFKGKKRELVAQDYVYAFKRFADSANKSPAWSEVESYRMVGLLAVRQAALDQKKPFDYDREVEGLRAIDRYTIRFTLEEPRPRFIELIAGGDVYGAVAREVVEAYGDQAEAHPVGTGPFKLVTWRRSSFLAFERNPDFRAMFYDAEPAADDTEGQALVARFKGRRLPMIDRVEVSIIEEEQPRWLSFVTGEADLAYRVGFQFVNQAMPGGKVAPNLAKRGIRGYPIVEPAANYLFFNMEDATVGGYTADKVALRRAVSLGMNTANEIAYAYNGQAVPAQSAYLPFTSGYDPKFKSEVGDYDPARAKALLDLYGYTDRNGDGWRERPDGSPLVLVLATTSSGRDRKILEVFTKNMTALGIRTQANVAQWPENLKSARAGKLAMWQLGSLADAPDGIGALARLDSRQIGGQNFARFKMPALDVLYDKLQGLPDGPERDAAFAEAQKIALAYLPYKYKLNRLAVDMSYPWVIGYRHPVFWNDFWQYVDVDQDEKARWAK